MVKERVAAIYVLYEHLEIHIYLLHQKLANSYKLVLYLANGDASLAMNLYYIQTYLKNKTLVLMNQDFKLGEGWDKVSTLTLRSHEIMYALTRQSPEKSNQKFGSCDKSAKFVGSHDVFVVHVAANFTNEMLSGLNFVQNVAGMGNVLMWYFEKHIAYRILNPSKIVFAHHNHCIHVKLAHWKRYNNNGKSGSAPFFFYVTVTF